MGIPGRPFAGDYKRHAMGEWKERKAIREMLWALEEGAAASQQIPSQVMSCAYCGGSAYEGESCKGCGGRQFLQPIGGQPK